MTPDHDTTRLRRYVLGALPEEEHAAIEQQYFTDEAALERLSIVEEELIEDYLEDRLDADARDRFERHYLSTPGHRARVSAMRGLITTARAGLSPAVPESLDRNSVVQGGAPIQPQAAPRESRESRARIAATARWPPFQQAALAASIALVLGPGAVWLFNLRHDDSRPSASTTPAAAPNGPSGTKPSQPPSPIASSPSAPDGPKPVQPPSSVASSSSSSSPSVPSTGPPSRAPQAPVVVSLSLSAIATRGAGPDPAVTIPANADALLLRLETGPDDLPLRRGRAVLRTVEGDELWSGAADAPSTPSPGVRALVRIPAASLRAGDLIVELHGIDASGRESEVARYMIRVRLVLASSDTDRVDDSYQGPVLPLHRNAAGAVRARRSGRRRPGLG